MPDARSPAQPPAVISRTTPGNSKRVFAQIERVLKTNGPTAIASDVVVHF